MTDTPLTRAALWQPIDTAPEDGRTFLAWCPSRGAMVAWRHNPSSRTDEILLAHTSKRERPTHWQPLPEPPLIDAALSE